MTLDSHTTPEAAFLARNTCSSSSPTAAHATESGNFIGCRGNASSRPTNYVAFPEDDTRCLVPCWMSFTKLSQHAGEIGKARGASLAPSLLESIEKSVAFLSISLSLSVPPLYRREMITGQRLSRMADHDSLALSGLHVASRHFRTRQIIGGLQRRAQS